MAEQILYEPKKLYAQQLEHQFHDNAGRFYDELAKKAGTDIGLNDVHVKAYMAEEEEVEAASKKLGAARTGRGFAIAGIILAFVLAVIALVVGIMNVSTLWWLFIVTAVLVFVGVFGIVLTHKKLGKKVKEAEALLEEKKKKAQEALGLCKADMASLNALLDDAMPQEVL